MTPDPLETPVADDSASEHPAPDPRVVALLDDLGYSYEVSPETGTFKVAYGFEDNRTQVVYIRSLTEEFLGVELREISSPALSSSGIFDGRTANFLLRDNANLKFGAWCIEIGEDNAHFAVFSVKVSAALPVRPFAQILELVAKVADSTEERLSGLDEF
jgi:hypothetical protein